MSWPWAAGASKQKLTNQRPSGSTLRLRLLGRSQAQCALKARRPSGWIGIGVLLEAKQLGGDQHGLAAVFLASRGRAAQAAAGPGAAVGEPVGPVAQNLAGHLAQPSGVFADELALGLARLRSLPSQRQCPAGESPPVARFAHLGVVDEALMLNLHAQNRLLRGGRIGAKVDTAAYVKLDGCAVFGYSRTLRRLTHRLRLRP